MEDLAWIYCPAIPKAKDFHDRRRSVRPSQKTWDFAKKEHVLAIARESIARRQPTAKINHQVQNHQVPNFQKKEKAINKTLENIERT